MNESEHKKSPWCTMTQAFIERSGLQHQDLARLVGVSPGQITHLLTGRTRPPLSDIDRFCDAFGLEGSERESYITQAHLAHSPLQVRLLVEKQAAEIRRLRLELATSRTSRRQTEG